MEKKQLRSSRITNAVLALQAEIEADGLLSKGGLLNLQTGSGKTYLARKAAILALREGGRVVYLCPLRSLANEVARDWASDPELVGVKIGLFTGDHGADNGSDIIRPSDARLIVMTAEKLDAYLRTWWNHMDWLAELSLVVVDELHTIGDGVRGAALDGTITRLRQINPYAALLCLTATMGNVPEVAQWLNVDHVTSRVRWVPLQWRVATFRPGQGGMANRAAVVVREAAQTAADGGQTLVFVQSRLRAEQLAMAVRQAGLQARAHHAGLGAEEREEVERLMRAGELQCVVATPTLALGVNLPVRKVVIHDLQRYDAGQAVGLSVNQVWQLGGRAGRKGLDEVGEVVLLAAQHESGAAWQYTKGQFEPVISAMDEPAALAGQVLAMFGSRLAATTTQLERLMEKTLAWRQHPDLAAALDPCAADMVAAGMLADKGEEGLWATRLGFAAVRHMVSPATARAWVSAFEDAGERLSFADILILAASARECGIKLRVRKEQLQAVAGLLRHEPLWLREQGCAKWAEYTGQSDGASIVSGVAAAAVLREWSRCGDESVAGGALGLGAGELSDLRRDVLRMLVALKDVAGCVGPRRKARSARIGSKPKLGEKLRAVIAMTTCGLNARAATLSLVEGIGPVFARRLVDSGVQDITALANVDRNALMAVDGISEKRASAWVSAAQDLDVRGGAYRYELADEWSGLLVDPDPKADLKLLQGVWVLGKE